MKFQYVSHCSWRPLLWLNISLQLSGWRRRLRWQAMLETQLIMSPSCPWLLSPRTAVAAQFAHACLVEPNQIPDSKIVPDMFTRPIYCVEWWHLGSPLLFTRSEPQVGHTMATCQPTANSITQNLGPDPALQKRNELWSSWTRWIYLARSRPQLISYLW